MRTICRYAMCAGILVGLCGIASAQDFRSYVDRYVQNQEAIETIIARGTVEMEMMNGDGEVLTRTDSAMTVYMKRPDMVRMEITSPMAMSMVQRGDLISQRMDGGGVVSTRAEEGSNMAENFFGAQIRDLLAAAAVVESSYTTIDDERVARFVTRVDGEDTAGFGRSELYFDDTGMLRRSTIRGYDGIDVSISFTYGQYNGVFVAERTETVLRSADTTTTTVTQYSAVDVNTPISDQEFDLQ